MTLGLQVDILMEDYCTFDEAVKHIKNGVWIYKAEDFENNLDDYLDDWGIESTDEEADKYCEMIKTGRPLDCWGVVDHDGKRYYIEYNL